MNRVVRRGMATGFAVLGLALAGHPGAGAGPAAGAGVSPAPFLAPRDSAAVAPASVAELAREFENLLVALQPVRASALGLTRGDGDLGPSGRAETAAATRAWRELLARLDATARAPLSRDDRLDVALMAHDLRLRCFEIDSLRVWEEHASWGIDLVANGLLGVASREGMPLRARAVAIVRRSLQVPRFLESAAWRLERIAPRDLEHARDQAAVVLRFQEQRVPRIAARLADAMLANQLLAANAEASVAVNRFLRVLEARGATGPDTLFVMGPGRLLAGLKAAEGIDATLEGLIAVAEGEIAALGERLRALARSVDTTLTVDTLLDGVAADHPPEDGLLGELESALAEVHDFTVSAGFLSIPSGPAIRVLPAPSSARWSNAGLAVPGPFESTARTAAFYLNVPEPGDPPLDRYEALRFLNRPFLLSLVAHEAWPGHYVQARRLATNPRRVRRIVTSQAFVEGWAHYSEFLLAEMGFRSGDASYRAAVLGSALRRAGRLRVALGIHAEGWSVEEAAAYLIGTCRVEPVVARREAERGAFDPLYLVYTLGRLGVEDLRDAARAREGEAFDLREFHERLLGLGAPPLHLARAALLGEEIRPPVVAE